MLPKKISHSIEESVINIPAHRKVDLQFNSDGPDKVLIKKLNRFCGDTRNECLQLGAVLQQNDSSKEVFSVGQAGFNMNENPAALPGSKPKY